MLHLAAEPEQRLGLTDNPIPTSSPQPVPDPGTSASNSDTATAVNLQELPAAQPASPSSMYQPMDTHLPEQTSRQTHLHEPPSNAASTSIAAGNAAAQGQSAPQTALASQSRAASPGVDPKDISDEASEESSAAKPVPAGFDRQIHVFTREAAAAAEASSRLISSTPCCLSQTLASQKYSAM